jgi:hypothetical protein
LEFGLTVVGRALEYLPYFIYAFMRLGETGLGRPVTADGIAACGGGVSPRAGSPRRTAAPRGRFSLEDVCAMSPDGLISIYEAGSQSLKKPAPYPTWGSIKARCEALQSARRLAIHFKTPARIKSDGRLNDAPEFHHLIRSLLRRLSSLSYFHCGGRLELDFRGLIERAHLVKRISSDLQWHDWERYSSRQKQKMTLGGFVGEMMFSGDFREFLPLLVWGEVLHIGKAASFGLGKYTLEHN